MILYLDNVIQDGYLSADIERASLSRLSDDELIYEYQFLKYIDDMPASIFCVSSFDIYLHDYAQLVCEEMAERFYKNTVFKDVF